MKLRNKKGKEKLKPENVSQFYESESEEKTSGSEYQPSDDESLIKKGNGQKVVPTTNTSESESSQSELDSPNVSIMKRKKSLKVSTPKLNLSYASESESNKKLSSKVDCTNSKKRKRCDSISDSKSVSDSDSKSVSDSDSKSISDSKSVSDSDSTSNSDLISDSKSGRSKNIKKKQKVQKSTLDNNSTNTSLDLSINIQSVGSVLKNKHHEILKTSVDGVKKYACFYCLKERKKTKNPDKKVHFSKLVDHYESAHANEKLIEELMQIPKTKRVKAKKINSNQARRQEILTQLRNKASLLNNREAKDVSEYFVSRRPQKNRSNTVANYGTCFNCSKQLSLTSLNKHVAKCTEMSFKNKRIVKANSRATIGDYCEIATEESIKIISVIRESDVLDEIRYDKAIFMWLNAEAAKYETVTHNRNKIRANLRRLGRLMIEMKHLNININEFADILHEDYYDDFIEACRTLGKPDPITKFMASSSTANDMCYLVKNVANIYHVMIGKKQKKKRKEIDAFLKKLQTLWHSSIGNTIAETQARNKRNKLVKLPTQEDMTCLREYLEKEMLESYQSLKIKYSDDSYLKLRDSVESYLHVTNCRRAGEIEKLSLEDYKRVQIDGEDCRIEVRGKRTKAVPIVFNKTISKYINLLIRKRNEAKIFAANPYVFSNIKDISSEFKFMSACNLLRKFSEECGAKDPETLRGTLFRKQVATKGMEKGIDNQEVEKLSGFLGHTPRIHIQNYRQSVFKRDIAMAQLVKEAQTNSSKSRIDNNVDDVEQDESTESNSLVESEKFTEEEEENNVNASNCSISSVSTKKKTPWTQECIDALLAYFPNALNTDHKVPNAKDINRFLRSTDVPNMKCRKEPDVRSWIHKNRQKLKKTTDVPIRNNVPSYIYAKFDKYIAAKKVPSSATCGKFLSRSPSKANLTIRNIQNWVKIAIKRKSM